MPTEIVRQLRAITGPLDAESAAALAARLHHVSLPAGSLLFQQGEPGDAAYFVVSGRLGVTVRRDDGRHVPVGEASAGDSIGELALAADEPRLTTARAVEDSELLRLSKAGYDAVVARGPAGLARFTEAMAERLAQRARVRQALSAIRAGGAVTRQECLAVAAETDAPRFNRAAALLYHRLSLDLALVLGAQDANWFSFASRVSRVAGPAIQQEDAGILEPVGRFVLQRVPEALVARVQRLSVARRVDRALAPIAARLAESQRRTVAEIAPLFVRLATACAEHPYDPAWIDAREEAAAHGQEGDAGDDLLRGGLRAYYDAAFEPRGARRAELILLGSLRIARHEQLRLDAGLDDALAGMGVSLAVALVPWFERLPRGLRARVGAVVLRRARRIIAARLARVHLPSADLRRGDDLAPRRRRVTPSTLPEVIEDPDLAATIAQAGGRHRSRRIEWADADGRLRYLADVFGAFQPALEMFEPPPLCDQPGSILDQL